MKLVLTGQHTEVLIVHMHVMRKNIKNVLKRNYGGSEGKRLLKVYDSIKESLKARYGLLTEYESFPFLFTEEQMNLLHSFLAVFFSKVESEIASKAHKPSEQEAIRQNMQLPLLEEVREKVNSLKEVSLVG